MSEAIRCEQCKKTTNLSDAADWWHIEDSRTYWSRGDLAGRCDEGGDFCSDTCAYNFFKDMLKSPDDPEDTRSLNTKDMYNRYG